MTIYRLLQVKCLELEEVLEEQGYKEDEIEEKVGPSSLVLTSLPLTPRLLSLSPLTSSPLTPHLLSQVTAYRKMLLSKEGEKQRFAEVDEFGRPVLKETHQVGFL